MLRWLYLSPLGLLISVIQNLAAFIQRPFMVYGYWDAQRKKFRKLTRISSQALLLDQKHISVGDQVWIWHFTIVDGSHGVTIGEGTQIGAWVGIFSHGSQTAIRLHGREYIKIQQEKRVGYTRGPVEIGPFCFVGAGAIILPGTVLGRGCLVGAQSVVSGQFPPFSIIKGNPAKVVGDTRSLDARYMADPAVSGSYFDLDAMREWNARIPVMSET